MFSFQKANKKCVGACVWVAVGGRALCLIFINIGCKNTHSVCRTRLILLVASALWQRNKFEKYSKTIHCTIYFDKTRRC